MKLLRPAVRILIAVAVVVFSVWIVVAQPTFKTNGKSSIAADPAKLREHVDTLSTSLYPRDFQHVENLNKCADYIAQHFQQAGAVVESQPYIVGGQQYRNVIGKFGAEKGARVVVGAHYDTCDALPGADDNASGIAALIELAYLLGSNAPNCAVELVAYVLEEPPFFRTGSMGSAVHAKSIADDKANIRGVIVLEMVGYFKDEWGSQSYPLPLFHLMYPSRANFIGVVGRWDQGDWVKAVKVGMKGTTDLPVFSIRAPAIIPGIDLSDHRSYWPHGFNALMVTDTAFYRNKAYHTSEDTADKLDYNRMAKVVVGVFAAIGAM